MHKSDIGCQVLLESTVTALDEEALQKLLATTQHSNMMICIKSAIARYVTPTGQIIWFMPITGP